MSLGATTPILKSNDELQIAWGWASVVEERGIPVIDEQGDYIASDTLMKAAHQFMTESRVGGLMHAVDEAGAAIQVGEVVESMVMTHDVQKALGINLGKVGWFVGVHFPDPALYALVKSGKLSAFSVGGSGVRTKVEV